MLNGKGTCSTVAGPSYSSRDVTWCRAAPLPRHFRAFAGHRRSFQSQHGGSHSRKRDVEAGKYLAALRKRAKPEPGKILCWEGAEFSRGCGGHAEGMFYLVSSAAGVSTHHVLTSPHCGQGVLGSLHCTRTGHQSVSPCRPLFPPPAPTLLLFSQSIITPGLAGRAQMALGHPCASTRSPHPSSALLEHPCSDLTGHPRQPSRCAGWPGDLTVPSHSSCPSPLSHPSELGHSSLPASCLRKPPPAPLTSCS